MTTTDKITPSEDLRLGDMVWRSHAGGLWILIAKDGEVAQLRRLLRDDGLPPMPIDQEGRMAKTKITSLRRATKEDLEARMKALHSIYVELIR